MPLYTNNTRYPAIVTLNVTKVSNPKTALKTGQQEVFDAHPSLEGFNDILVDAGKSVEVMEGTEATVVSVRSCP